MKKPPYEPPTQSVFGQVFDAFLMLALVFCTLYLPLLLKLAGGGTTTKEFQSPTWEALGQNAAMAGQWEKLGFTPDSAATIIGTKFDYTFSWVSLVITAVVIIGYYVVMLRWSEKEYRDVIAEHFDDAKSDARRPNPHS